ncbi:phage tail-collar fiber domain-containing protein [Vibrio sp. V09_P4A23P171]|uniref:phage tail-collar fiber domain-containing protein n=1 Tax=Vibrio sp. V09_P4A23P171 TaxID=1938664 RepID=UPI001595A154|nr:phage tail protein [Vibrio sp. V09_P4A23P171]
MANEPLKAAVVTDIGMAKLEAAYLAGEKVVISEMALGDSNLVYVEPNSSFIELVNEFGRQTINDGNTTDSWINALVYVDSTQFANKSVLEFGLYDSDGDLIVYSSYTPSLVPDIGPNYIQLEIECSVNLYNASAVTLEVTPIYPQATELEMGIAKVATSEQVETGTNDSAFLTVKKFLYALDVTQVIDKLVNNLWLKLAARIFPVGAAIPWYTDTAPSGFAMMKGQAFNKATYPQLAAVFPTGVLPDMRGRAAVGKFDGETVGAFEQGEIKSHNHSGSVTSTDLGTKTTSTNWHDHNLKTNTNPWGDAFAASWIGDNNWLMQGFKGAIGNIATQYANARNSIDSEAHNHTVAIGAHGHGLAINANGGSRNTVDNIKVNWIVRLA